MAGIVSAVSSLFKTGNTAKKTKNLSQYVDDIVLALDDFSTTVKNDAVSVTTTQKNEVQSISDKIGTIDDYSPTTSNPATLPDYMSMLDNTMQEFVKRVVETNKQTSINNELRVKSLEIDLMKLEHSKVISETLVETLPSIVVQLQELSKLTKMSELKTDIDTAYKELELENSLDLIEAVRSSVSSEVGTLNNQIMSSINDTLSSMNANIYSSASSQLNIAQKMTSLSENATKQKEIADYKTTPQTLVNLDGNSVSTMKPIEAETVKNIVDAKNATDEMEFELDNDTLDYMYSSIPIPTFTKLDMDSYFNHIFSGSSFNG